MNRSVLLRLAFVLVLLGVPCWGQLNGLQVVRGLGHRDFGNDVSTPENVAANLIETREFSGPIAVAVDNARGFVYVSDLNNHRVLAWRTLERATSGAEADLVIGQLTRFGTTALGPGSELSSGLTFPTGLAVDRNGALWVADAGNNRVLRFNNPFEQTEDVPRASFVIGQANLQTRTANRGGSVNAGTLATSTNDGTFRVSILFDPAGNLWVTDAGNHRVLRYPVAALSGNNGPNADLVLGQTEFEQRATPGFNITAQLNKSAMFQPSSLALDEGGRLYVADGILRVLVYVPEGGNFRNGQAAARVVGVFVATQQGQSRLNETALGGQNQPEAPDTIFVLGNELYVVDTASHRLLRFAPYANWEPETQQRPSPPANLVIGQENFSVGDLAGANRARRGVQPNGFFRPRGVAVAGNRLLIADSSNHRVVVYPIDGTRVGDTAIAVIGQPNLERGGENRVDGRGFHFSSGLASRALEAYVAPGFLRGTVGTGIALDTRNADNPLVYIADPNNNRVLGYRDLYKLRMGRQPDLVIGQTDFESFLPNAFSSTTAEYNDRGLYLPRAVAVDADGNLYVADYGNRRVVRFPTPFDQTEQRANLVLGQPSLNGTLEAIANAQGQIVLPDATSRNMVGPAGLAFSSDGSLAVSDLFFNRVLLFRKSGDFQNGQAAGLVLGQSTFTARGTGQMNQPQQMSFDTDDGLYVVDGGNNRVLFFERAPVAANGQAPQQSIGIGSVTSVVVNKQSGDLWISNLAGDARAITRFSRSSLLTGTPQAVETLISRNPGSIALDAFGHVVAAELVNRVVLYSPSAGVTNGANFAPATQFSMSPGMLVTAFGDYRVARADATSVPLPRVLSNVRVMVGQREAPMLFINGTQVNFQIPKDTPTNGRVVVTVEDVNTERPLSVTSVSMFRAAPGCFAGPANAQGEVRLAAINQDGTPNSASNPARVNQVVTIFCTGLGLVNNMPEDGTPATGAAPLPVAPQAFMAGRTVAVDYAGLAPGFVGLWQVNLRIPADFVPETGDLARNIVIRAEGVVSNLIGVNPEVRRNGFINVRR